MLPTAHFIARANQLIARENQLVMFKKELYGTKISSAAKTARFGAALDCCPPDINK